MKSSTSKISNLYSTGTAPRLFVPVVFTLLVSACVTTESQNSQKQEQFQSSIQQQARVNCAAPTGQQAQSTNALQTSEWKVQNPQNCLPKGVIEIAENHAVDPEVREEFQQAVALLKQEKYPKAIRLLKAITGKSGKFTGPYINLGIAYARMGELKKAEESLQNALNLNNAHPVAMNEMGLVYRKTGRYVEARKLYEDLLSFYPEFLPVRKNLGVLCDIYIQDLSCALENYEAYLEGIPDDEKVKIWVADVKSRM